MSRENFDKLESDSLPDAMLAICFAEEHSLGVRILADATAGQCLHHFDGVVGPKLGQHSLQVAPGQHIAQTRYIGYLTHGCNPNCRLDMVQQELVALRAIRKGEWLTIDYAATEDELFRQFACNCGAATCRHWIVGSKDQIHADGAAHLARLAQSADSA